VVSAATAKVSALKDTVFVPARTVAETGGLTALLLLESATVSPLVGAARFRVRVQVIVVGNVTLAGVHVSAVTCTLATVREAVRVSPAAVAVIVALPTVAPAVAVKVALATPAATVTEAGTVTTALLLASATGNALVVVLLRVTVQVLVPPGLIVAELQVIELNAAGPSRLTVALAEVPPIVAVS
jgi:hypothetical protein